MRGDSRRGVAEGYRSVLYVPGHSEKMLLSSPGRGADALVFDLEDGVHPDKKADARKILGRWLGEATPAPSWWVRVNHRNTPWGRDDVRMALSLGLGIVVPKVESADDLDWIRSEGSPASLILMIETAGGLVASASLAQQERVEGLMFGAADYRASMRLLPAADEAEIAYARQCIVHAARAADVVAIDSPWFDPHDDAGLIESAHRARSMGFEAKSTIHPRQVGIVNGAFAPSSDELAWARRVVDTLEKADRTQDSLALLDGSLIEAPHRAMAHRILAAAKRRDPEG